MKTTILITILLLLVVAGCASQPPTETSDIVEVAQIAVEQDNEVKTMGNRIAVIETNHGTMEFELFEKRAPITTKNFIDLAEKGFYDGIIFHRIIKEFMLQGGDPTGTGMGGPGYEIDDEFHPQLTHSRAGRLSMANSGPNTGGSQFFITLKATPWLDNKHAVFGKIIEGEDVLQKIGLVETGSGDKPKEDVVMTKVTIK